MSAAPSGRQFEIRTGSQSATVVEVGGGIRRYTVGGRDVLEPYGVDEMCDGARGAVLVPWPNRLGDGRYSFDGSTYQVALTEPAKNNAIHGFLRWRPWELVGHASDRVTVGTTLFPLMGYPFSLQVLVTYSLGDTGLSVTTSTTNIGARPAPYGCGQHPYLSPGAGLVDDCKLELAAGTRIITDPHRKLPIGTESVDATEYDFRQGRNIGSQTFDDAFTDLARDNQGRAWVRLTGQDRHTVHLWLDESYHLVELFTGDTLSPARRRHGLGAEPMSCPPNAFQDDDGVVRLEPGATATSRWGVLLTPPPAA